MLDFFATEDSKPGLKIRRVAIARRHHKDEEDEKDEKDEDELEDEDEDEEEGKKEGTTKRGKGGGMKKGKGEGKEIDKGGTTGRGRGGREAMKDNEIEKEERDVKRNSRKNVKWSAVPVAP